MRGDEVRSTVTRVNVGLIFAFPANRVIRGDKLFRVAKPVKLRSEVSIARAFLSASRTTFTRSLLKNLTTVLSLKQPRRLIPQTRRN